MALGVSQCLGLLVGVLHYSLDGVSPVKELQHRWLPEFLQGAPKRTLVSVFAHSQMSARHPDVFPPLPYQ